MAIQHSYKNTFSKLFLREFKRIETTSDNFIHKLTLLRA